MVKKLLVLVALAGLILSLGVSSPAAADEPPAEDPTEAQVVLDVESSPYEPLEDGGGVGIYPAASTKCKTVVAKLRGENVTGADLWKFEQTWTFCWNTTKNKITSRYVETYTWAKSALLWKYNGVINQSSTTGTPWTDYKQVEFLHCILMPWGEVCPSSKRPWLKIVANGNGTYAVTYAS
jgi:hypothetical protein